MGSFRQSIENLFDWGHNCCRQVCLCVYARACSRVLTKSTIKRKRDKRKIEKKTCRIISGKPQTAVVAISVVVLHIRWIFWFCPLAAKGLLNFTWLGQVTGQCLVLSYTDCRRIKLLTSDLDEWDKKESNFRMKQQTRQFPLPLQ